MRKLNVSLLVMTLVLFFNATITLKAQPEPTYTYRVIQKYPHDPNAFTQGLVYSEGVLYEGTGLYGQSSLRKVKLNDGRILRYHSLPDSVFGEGITIFHDRIIQLTWREHRGYVYDKLTWDLLREFTYPTEGWGLTHDGEHLIMSDGSATLRFVDPDTFETIKEVAVISAGVPVANLNELEYINGEIFANVWLTDRIVRINPDDGQVTGWIDLSGLLDIESSDSQPDVLNGIAYDQENQRLFVTGKLWPYLFEIKLVPRE